MVRLVHVALVTEALFRDLKRTIDPNGFYPYCTSNLLATIIVHPFETLADD